jgi:tetratricopeptide (TPR) repeat protein
MVIATSFVEMERYTDALPYVRKAIQKSEEPKEGWYMLELAIHFEKQDFRAAVALLRKMVQFWPDSGKYWDMLASAYLELKQDKNALDTLMVAYTNGMIDDSTRIMTVVQLNMVLDIPYTAGVILDREMESGRIDTNKKNLDILLQAWLSSKEYKKAMVTLDRLTPYVEDGSYQMRKAGIHNELGEWALVVSSVEKALGMGVDDPADAHMLAGMAYTELKQFDNALASFRRCRDAGDNKQRQNANAWISFVQDKIAVARVAN